MNRQKTFFKAPAEFFLKLLDQKERDVGFKQIIFAVIARHHLIYGKNQEDCMSELGIYYDIPDDALSQGLIILKEHQNSVFFDIERQVFLDFLIQYRSELEYVCQIGYMSLKNMIGRNRTYCRVYNDRWLLRMSGYKDNTINGELHPVIKRYSDPRKLRALKEYIMMTTNMNFSTRKTRGFLASIKLSSEELNSKLEKPHNKEEVPGKKRNVTCKPLFTDISNTPNKTESVPLWRTDYNEYIRLFEDAKKTVLSDVQYKQKMEYYYSNIDFEKSIEKVCDYWMSEVGWTKCKSYKSKTINPIERIKNNFDRNKIYKPIYNNHPIDYKKQDGQFDDFNVEEWNNKRR